MLPCSHTRSDCLRLAGRTCFRYAVGDSVEEFNALSSAYRQSSIARSSACATKRGRGGNRAKLRVPEAVPLPEMDRADRGQAATARTRPT